MSWENEGNITGRILKGFGNTSLNKWEIPFSYYRDE
jgi:hypothetical protein